MINQEKHFKGVIKPLSYSDKRPLLKNLFGTGLFIIISSVIVIFMYLSVNDVVGEKILLFFFAVFFSLPILIIWRTILDLIYNRKFVGTGKIEKKETRSVNKSRNRHYIFLQKKKFEVNINQFNSVKTGDEIELHYTRFSKHTLDVISFVQDRKDIKNTFLKTETSITDFKKNKEKRKRGALKREFTLTKEDIRALKKVRNDGMIVRLYLLILFVIFFVVSLFFGLSLPPILFGAIAFLVVILLIIRSIYRSFISFNSEIKSNKKIAWLLLVLDKKIFNSRTKNQQWKIETEIGSMVVSRQTFDEAKVGGRIVLFTGKETEWPITTNDEEASKQLIDHWKRYKS